MRRLAEWMTFGCGLVILLAALPHAFLGWPGMRSALGPYGVDAETLGGLAIGWHFGSFAMVTLGAVVLFAFFELRRGRAEGRRYALAVGVCYLAFGAAAFFARGMNPHFVPFIVLGVLLAAAVAVWRV